MKAVIQRVTSASVTVENRVIGEIQKGLLVLIGFASTDTQSDIDWMVQKILKLRLFNNAEGKPDHDVTDINGGILIVSQFTLYANCEKGRRPSFISAAPPDIAIPLYNTFLQRTRDQHPHVASGQFGAEMTVQLSNDGPFTICLEK